MGGAGAHLYSAFSKRPSLTVRLAAWPMVERSAQWPGPLDHTVTMVALEGAPSGLPIAGTVEERRGGCAGVAVR
jgi:hypothetical protein